MRPRGLSLMCKKQSGNVKIKLRIFSFITASKNKTLSYDCNTRRVRAVHWGLSTLLKEMEANGRQHMFQLRDSMLFRPLCSSD